MSPLCCCLRRMSNSAVYRRIVHVYMFPTAFCCWLCRRSSAAVYRPIVHVYLRSFLSVVGCAGGPTQQCIEAVPRCLYFSHVDCNIPTVQVYVSHCTLLLIVQEVQRSSVPDSGCGDGPGSSLHRLTQTGHLQDDRQGHQRREVRIHRVPGPWQWIKNYLEQCAQRISWFYERYRLLAENIQAG